MRRKRVSERPGTSAAASLLEWLITIRQPDQLWDVLQVINRLKLLDEPLVDLSQRDAFFRELAGWRMRGQGDGASELRASELFVIG